VELETEWGGIKGLPRITEQTEFILCRAMKNRHAQEPVKTSYQTITIIGGLCDFVVA